VLPDAATGGRPCFFSREIVPVQGGYGVVFAPSRAADLSRWLCKAESL